MIKTSTEKFQKRWNNISSKGSKKYIIQRNVLKNTTVFTLLYFFEFYIIKGNNYIKSIHRNKLFIVYFCISIIISVGSYYLGKYLWKYNNDKYMKLSINSIAENRSKISSIEKINEQ